MSKTHDQLIDLKGKIDEIERLFNNYLTRNPDVVYIIDRIETIERERKRYYNGHGSPKQGHKKNLVNMLNELENKLAKLYNRISLDHDYKLMYEIKTYYQNVVYRDRLIDEILEDGDR